MATRLILIVAALLLSAVILTLSVDRLGSPATTPEVSKRVASQPSPRVVVDQTQFDFGTMDLGQAGRHVFAIENGGPGVLELRKGSATCSCTIGELGRSRLQPGEQAQVRLTWTPPKSAAFFSQSVQVLTNDPARPTVTLNVTGRVLAHLRCEPETVVFSDMRADEDAFRSVLVYSQAWEEFDVLDIESSDPHCSATLAEPDADALARAAGHYGYGMTVRLSPELPRGDFRATVKLRVAPRGQSAYEAREIELPVHAKVLGHISLLGAGLDANRRLHWGTLPAGKASQRTMAMLVRGGNRDLQISAIKTQPSWLQVQVSDPKTVGKGTSQYQIQLTVPADAPVEDHLNERAGWVSFAMDHPQEPEVRFAVEFNIAP